MERPKVIFLDAVGTMIGIKGSVGQVYSAIARSVNVDVPAAALEQAFRSSFRDSPPAVFPGVDFQQIPEKEFQWWNNIIRLTFDKVGVLQDFSDFSGFATKLYAHFATPKPWYVYKDIKPALKTWRSQGIELGVISNFDTRLYALIELLELRPFFSSITISSVVGAAKPDSKIFLTALDKHHCSPEQAWHIGDSINDDYEGAKKIGMKSFLIERE